MAAHKRWSCIPCNVYPKDITDEMAKALELSENLVRTELTSEERKRGAADYNLLLMRIEETYSPKHSEQLKDTSGSPSQKSAVSRDGDVSQKSQHEKMGRPDTSWMKPLSDGAGVSIATLKRWYESYTEESGIKCTPSEATTEIRTGFSMWLKKKADEDEADKKAKAEKKAKEDADAAAEKIRKETERVRGVLHDSITKAVKGLDRDFVRTELREWLHVNDYLADIIKLGVPEA